MASEPRVTWPCEAALVEKQEQAMNDKAGIESWIDRFAQDYLPCGESMKWLIEHEFPDPQAAWDACQRGDWMAWLLDREMPHPNDRWRVEGKRLAVKIKLARHFAENALTPRGLEFLGLLEKTGLVAATIDWKNELRKSDILAYVLDYASVASVIGKIEVAIYGNELPPPEFYKTVADVIREVCPKAPRILGQQEEDE